MSEAVRFEDPSVVPGTVVVAETGAGKFSQIVLDGRHRLVADEPVAVGGADTGPGPYELLLMSLGVCTSMTLRLYATKKQLPLERVIVRLKHAKRYIEDCADCAEKPVLLDHIEREIELVGSLNDEQRARLLEITGYGGTVKQYQILIDTRLV